jgi:hypothetical protein
MVTPDEAASHGAVKQDQYHYTNLEVARRKAKELNFNNDSGHFGTIRNRDGSYDLWRYPVA